LLKTFFFTIYLLSFNLSFYLFLSIIFWSIFLLVSDLRKKFISFILVVFLFSVFGFVHDLDGIFVIFLIAEFTIFLVFLMSYTQLYPSYSFISSNIRVSNIAVITIVILFNYNATNSFYFYYSYYNSLNSIISSDFYILYHLLFDQMPVLTLIVILIISFFSLFFIIMYFSLKLVKSFSKVNYKNVYWLRKQSLLKQTTFLNKIYTFQN
jgi:hypothetical protein